MKSVSERPEPSGAFLLPRIQLLNRPGHTAALAAFWGQARSLRRNGYAPRAITRAMQVVRGEKQAA